MDCIHAIEAVLHSGSHFLTKADWGCKDAEHKGWSIVEVESKEQALAIVPPAFRAQAKVLGAGFGGLELTTMLSDALSAEPDLLLIDKAATPGLTEEGTEFYAVPGAFALRDVLANFNGGHAIIGVMPFGKPIPPSPDTSEAILAAFAERGIQFVKDHLVAESGLADGPRVPANKQTLETKFPGVYAVGDVNGVGTPNAGVFAEGAARVVAEGIIAKLRGGQKPTGTYQPPSHALVEQKLEFGASRIQRWFGREWSAKG